MKTGKQGSWHRESDPGNCGGEMLPLPHANFADGTHLETERLTCSSAGIRPQDAQRLCAWTSQ
ncbi:hypothetical protein OH492_16845 [Vibrio chagasii]|nr:hypothetical protein [Vibrio chagasii]